MKRAFAIAVLILVAGLAAWKMSHRKAAALSSEESALSGSQSAQSVSASALADAASPRASKTAGPVTAPVVAVPETLQDLRTIESFSDIFAAAHETTTPAALVRELQRAGLSPIGARDQDETTGSMIVVETQNTLPGSRYFRAQFFSDDQGIYQLQHMSFELKPGTSVDEVVSQLNRSLGPLPRASYADAEWKAWKLPGHYTLSIKKLNSEDVTETALHAYSQADVGTLRVALEADLPGHDDEPL